MAREASEDQEERPLAAEEGRAPPPLDGVAIAPGESAPAGAARAGWKSRLAAARRVGYPVALAAAVILFLFWPRDAGSGRKWDPGADDLVFLALVAYLARQVTKDSRVLLDLPGVISRVVTRGFKFNR